MHSATTYGLLKYFAREEISYKKLAEKNMGVSWDPLFHLHQQNEGVLTTRGLQD